MVEFIDNYWQSNPEEEYQKFLSLLGYSNLQTPQITKKYKISNNKIISKTDISGIIIKGLIDQNSINKERRIFSGFGSVAVIDRQGDYLPIHEFKPVMEKLMQRGAPVTDSHSNHVVGKIVDYTYKPTESGELGLYLTAEIYNHYPSDEETWHKIQDGEYTGFSLGGKAGTKTPTCTNIGCYNILGDIEAWEFSIVERPANQLANIDKVNKLAKASDVVDEVMSSIIQKERIYIKTPAEAPRNTQVYTGERGGKYYETEELPKVEREKVEKIPELNEISQSAKTFFGITKNPFEAGYIMSDGDMLDFSGRNFSNDPNNEYFNGIRGIEHETVQKLPGIQQSPGGSWNSIRDFTHKTNSIRTQIRQNKDSEKINMNLWFNPDNIPTLRQWKILSNIHQQIGNPPIYFDNGRDNGIVDNVDQLKQRFLETKKSYTITKDGHIIQKPLANYKDFNQCVNENKDKDDPNAYCGYIKHKVEKRADFTSEDAKRIGDQLNIDWIKIDQNEFLIGLNIELEHGTKFPETNVTDDDEIATAKIALAHLNEFPDYYNEGNGLPEMEKRLKGIKKGRIYVDNPSDAPKDKKVKEGKRGGLYYESDAPEFVGSKFFDTKKNPKLRQQDIEDRIHIEGNIKYAMSSSHYNDLNNTYQIDYLEVLPEMRGKGYGKKAVEELIKDALKNGAKHLRITSMGIDSDKFWTNLGLKNVGPTYGKYGGSYFYGDDNWMKDFINIKKYFITKEKIYVKSPSEAPKGVKVETGERGGLYYESEGKISSKEPKSEIEESSNLKEIVKQSYSMIPQHLKNEISKINEIINLGKTSKNEQIDHQGNYNLERIQLHNQIMNDFIGKNSQSIQKIAILFGGPTAAGKSTLLKNQNINFDQFVNINNDEIKEKLPGYNKINAMLYHDEARDIVEKLLKKSLIEKRNIIIDGTMRDFNKEITKIKLLKENGYKIKVISIIADPKITLKRATNRFIREKRFVPLDHIAKTSKEINLVQHKYKDYADEYELYDSSEFPPKRLI